MRKLQNEELNRKTIEEFHHSAKTPVVIVLDNVRSLNNIGSVFRTADAFLIEAIYLCGITATPPHREIQKTALGATESVSWKHFTKASDALTELKENGYTIIAIEQIDSSISLTSFIPEAQSKYALIFGNEISGVDEALLPQTDSCIEITQFGTKHSLNIAVTVGIVVWDFFNKLTATK